MRPGNRPQFITRLLDGLAGNGRALVLYDVNQRSGNSRSESLTRKPDTSGRVQKSFGLSWPSNVFAISHVAVAFSPDDPVYGIGNDKDFKQRQIGGIGLRGEHDVLAIPQSMLTRLRYNPFYSYQTRRVSEFTERVIARHSREDTQSGQ
jgi:hypothetical protein